MYTLSYKQIRVHLDPNIHHLAGCPWDSLKDPWGPPDPSLRTVGLKPYSHGINITWGPQGKTEITRGRLCLLIPCETSMSVIISVKIPDQITYHNSSKHRGQGVKLVRVN